jgi:DNA-directed RNA polymerase sigma subunit (sigma70/sigma32)
MARWKRVALFGDFSTRELRRILPLTPEEEDPSTLADRALVDDAVMRALQGLRSPRHRSVVVLRFGLLGSDCHSLDELTRLLGRYRREYVSACLNAALRRIRIALLRRRA